MFQGQSRKTTRYEYMNKLIRYLAYITYLKIYKVSDKPFEKAEVHISEFNNKWNIQALSSNKTCKVESNTTQNGEKLASVSIRNNQWNKFAIQYTSKGSAFHHSG